MTSGPPDEIRRAIAGEAAARSALVRRFEPLVRAAVHRQLGQDLRHVVDTDDLVQSTLAIAVADIGELSFRGEAAFRAWLLEVTRNRVQMAGRHHRAQRRDVRRQRHLPTALPFPAGQTGPLERAERHEDAERIRDAVERLQPADREIVRLRSFEGRGFEDIARLLGLAGESSARQRFQRALARLALEMDA